METKNIPTYHCSYCTKYYIRKYYAERHERFCKHNPNNKHKCFELCRHLIKSQETHNGVTTTDFNCKFMDKPMYSFKAEKGAIKYFREAYGEDGIIRMPLECEHYEVMYDDYDNFDW